MVGFSEMGSFSTPATLEGQAFETRAKLTTRGRASTPTARFVRAWVAGLCSFATDALAGSATGRTDFGGVTLHTPA
jgi:hypothetical protein